MSFVKLAKNLNIMKKNKLFLLCFVVIIIVFSIFYLRSLNVKNDTENLTPKEYNNKIK